MARDTSGSTVQAFLHRQSKKAGKRQYGTPRYQSTGDALYVWGNKVAEWRGNKIKLCDRGYQTLLTKNTLNTILDRIDSRCRIAQRKHAWHVYCARGGNWATGDQRTGPWPASGCITVPARRSSFGGSRRRRRRR